MQITVIIPTYNRLDYLSQAANSVLAQTYTDWECIIVNDYPPDSATLENLLSSWNDSRFRLVKHEVSQGGNASRNSGIKLAQGEIIAFLDDDDLWLPQKLEQHIACHQDSQAGVVFSGVTQCWEEEQLPNKTTLAVLPDRVLAAMSQGAFCPHTTSAVTVTKSCLDRCGLFDEKLISFQDWDMWYRMAAREINFACIREPLIIFRQHLGARTSKSIERRLQGLEMLLEKWQDRIENPTRFRHIFTKESYIALTNDLILQGQKQQALSCWVRFLVLIDRPFDFLQALKLLLMILLSNRTYSQILQTYRSLRYRQFS